MLQNVTKVLLEKVWAIVGYVGSGGFMVTKPASWPMAVALIPVLSYYVRLFRFLVKDLGVKVK